MCLGVPGRVVRWIDRQSPFATAEVEFGAARREVAMDCAAQAAVGDYVIVHAGVAISVLSELEAKALLAELDALVGFSLAEPVSTEAASAEERPQ